MTIKFQYCIYCRIKDNLSVYIGDNYEDYVCAEHTHIKQGVPDARDLKSIDDDVMEEEAKETKEAMKRSYRQLRIGCTPERMLT